MLSKQIKLKKKKKTQFNLKCNIHINLMFSVIKCCLNFEFIFQSWKAVPSCSTENLSLCSERELSALHSYSFINQH